MPQRELEGRQTSKLVTNMLYRQTLVWAGMPFCPWLPIIAVVLEFGIFVIMYFAMMGGAYQTPNEPWSAGQTTSAFVENYMKTLLFCAVPITMWLNVEPSCGAHEGVRVFDTFAELGNRSADGQIQSDDGWMDTWWDAGWDGSSFLVRYMMNPPFLLLILCVMLAKKKLREKALDTMTAESEKRILCQRAENMRLQSQLMNYVSKSDRALHLQDHHQAVHESIAAVLRSDAKDYLEVGSKRAKRIEKERIKTFRGVLTRVWSLPTDTVSIQQLSPRKTSTGVPAPVQPNLLWMVHNISEGTRPLMYCNHTALQCTPPKVKAAVPHRCDLCRREITEKYEFTMSQEMQTQTAIEGDTVILLVTATHGQCRATEYTYTLTVQGTEMHENFEPEGGLLSTRKKLEEEPETEGSPRIGGKEKEKSVYKIRVHEWMEKHSEVDPATQTPLTDRMVLEYKVELLYKKHKLIGGNDDVNASASALNWQEVGSEVLQSRWCRHSDILNLQQTFATCLRPESEARRKLDGFELPESHHHMNLHSLRFKQGHKDVSPAALKKTATMIENYLNGFLPQLHGARHKRFSHEDEKAELFAMQNPYFLAMCGLLGADADTDGGGSSDIYKHARSRLPEKIQDWKIEHCVIFCSDEVFGCKLEVDVELLEAVFRAEEIDGEEMSVMTLKRLRSLLRKSKRVAKDRLPSVEYRELGEPSDEQPLTSKGDELGWQTFYKARENAMKYM